MTLLPGVVHPSFARRPIWLPAFLFLSCLLASPPAFSQKPVVPARTPETAETLETAQKTNDRIAQLALAASVQQGEYVIGSGDLLGIEVFDVPELSRDVRVNQSGFVTLPLLPSKIQASGLTSGEFQDKVTDLLQSNGLVSDAQVTVTIKEQHSEPITIIGAVKMPLVVQAIHQMTLLQALSQAGGIADDAANTVIVTRAPHATDATNSSAGVLPQEGTMTIELSDLLDSGDPQYNIPLIGGDVVTVPRAGVIYAVGAVQHAGGFVMQSDRQRMTVLKVLSLAGGLTSTAKPREAVILRQNSGAPDRQQIPVDLNRILALKAEDLPLQKSDVLFVPDSTGKHAIRRTAEVMLSVATGVAIVRAGR
jgi:polysaccharide biosynthesis/export protein